MYRCILAYVWKSPLWSYNPHVWCKYNFTGSTLQGCDVTWLNTLRPRQNGRHFADHTFKRISLNEDARISIKISLKFVPKGPINNNTAMVQIMALRRSGAKPLSEPMMASLLTHICVTRPQWVKHVFTCVIWFFVIMRTSWQINKLWSGDAQNKAFEFLCILFHKSMMHKFHSKCIWLDA